VNAVPTVRGRRRAAGDRRAALTVSVAAVLVALPALLVTTQRYWQPFNPELGLTVSVARFTPS